ncbi:MAG TPA: hypothetical protein VI756_05570 [Blastocatellia bacterium]
MKHPYNIGDRASAIMDLNAAVLVDPDRSRLSGVTKLLESLVGNGNGVGLGFPQLVAALVPLAPMCCPIFENSGADSPRFAMHLGLVAKPARFPVIEKFLVARRTVDHMFPPFILFQVLESR